MAAQTVVAETQQQPLSLFKTLGSRVYLYEPPTTNGAKSQVTSSGTPPPDLVILMTWMEARPRHIAKYANMYMKLYPRAKIMIMTTTQMDFTFTLETTRRRQSEPGIPVVMALHTGSSASSPPRILVHCFSNGGGKRLYGFASLYRQRHPQHAHLPITALVYDSGPGWPHFSRGVHVFMQGAPKNFILRLFFRAWVYFFAAGLSFLTFYTPFFQEVCYKPMHGLNNPEIITTKAPRCYIYSEGDEAVPTTDVDWHAANAEERGYHVIKHHVKGSKHVQHAVVHGEVYWQMVVKQWQLGVKANDA